MLHFLLIGIALFGVYQWLSPGDSGGRRIVITQGVADDLVHQAHQVCPYSKATRGNVDVDVSAKV